MLLCSSSIDVPAWVGRNKDSLLRAASEKGFPVSATRGGSCTHPDQSWMLAHKALKSDDLCVGTSSPILPFFLGGGVALHVCLGWRYLILPEKRPIILSSRAWTASHRLSLQRAQNEMLSPITETVDFFMTRPTSRVSDSVGTRRHHRFDAHLSYSA
jgi:hypothetical protein